MAAGNQISARIVSVNASGGNTIVAVIATSPSVTLAGSAGTRVECTFSSPVVLPAGNYAILLSWDNAPTGTSILRIPTPSSGPGQPYWAGMPTSGEITINSIYTLAKAIPAAADVLSQTVNSAFIMYMRWSL